MLGYGREGLYPTIQFERCREGAEDFYLYQTLWALVERRRAQGAGSPAVEAAAALLGNAISGIRLNQQKPPDNFDPDALKAKVVAAIEALKD